MNSVDRLFSIIEPGEHIVAFVNGEERTARALHSEVSQLVHTLARCEEKTWLMWAKSAWLFAVQFYALVLSGKDIVLPGSVQNEHLGLISDNIQGVLADGKLDLSQVGKELKEINSIEAQEDYVYSVTLNMSPVNNSRVVLYTSGSTGEPKAIFKNVKHLAEEVLAQHEMWGHELAQHPVISTVGHQHIYGLLHYVLWPLYRGAPLIDPVCHLAEEVFSCAEKYGPCVLVSSPTHLARFFVDDAAIALKKFAHLKAIYSSAGLLPRRVSASVEKSTGIAPIEIFGSTETGGVAWRQQSAQQQDDALWCSLVGIQTNKDSTTGCLKIVSNFIEDDSYLMSDLVDFIDEDHFILKGRADRVVKVEGKRLSLSEMESAIKTHPWVRDARLLLIKHRREEVCAVVQLHDSSSVQHYSRKELNQIFRTHLSARFELPLLPRKWRYVESLPVDAQGKTTQHMLQQLFELPHLELEARDK